MKRLDTVALRRIRLNGTIFHSAFSPISTLTKSCLRIVSFGGRGTLHGSSPSFSSPSLTALSLSLQFYSIAPRRNEIIPPVRIKGGAFNLKTFAMNAPLWNWLNNSFDGQNFPGPVFFCDASRNAISWLVSRRAFPPLPPERDIYISKQNVRGKERQKWRVSLSLFACQLQERERNCSGTNDSIGCAFSRCRKFDFEMKTFCSGNRKSPTNATFFRSSRE